MLSVVIPVYNTPIQDLHNCLDSIIAQTYKDFKVFIVDDGSKKEVADFLDKYAKKDSRLTVIHQTNVGVSAARNVGLAKADSQFITFVDADDTLENNFFREAISLISAKKLDLICGLITNCNNERNNKIKIYEDSNLIEYNDKVVASAQRKTNSSLSGFPTGRVYGKIYRRNVLSNIKFDEKLRYSEDSVFCIDLIRNTKKIGVSNRHWYNYMQHSYSILHETIDEQRIVKLYPLLHALHKRATLENNPRLKNAYKVRMALILLNFYKKTLKFKLPYKYYSKILESEEYSFLKTVNLHKYTSISLADKIFIDILTKTPVTFQKACYLLLRKSSINHEK
ncbi:glycosyltransferase [Candidatus Saccharibacteria bacterium]|nr:glycosyltransferase [Candidatus Saccharibacteria bacterium]